MISLADILSAKQLIKEKTTTYSNGNLKHKARIYSLICLHLQKKLGEDGYAAHVKYPTPDHLIVHIKSTNNSLLASLNLTKNSLCQQIHQELVQEGVVESNTKIELLTSMC